jgi:hypothetical protein
MIDSFIFFNFLKLHEEISYYFCVYGAEEEMKNILYVYKIHCTWHLFLSIFIYIFLLNMKFC